MSYKNIYEPFLPLCKRLWADFIRIKNKDNEQKILYFACRPKSQRFFFFIDYNTSEGQTEKKKNITNLLVSVYVIACLET